MLRHFAATLCLALLLACGGDSETGKDSPSTKPGPESGAGDGFSLSVRGEARPGQRLPVRLTGDRVDVEIALFRALDPVQVLAEHPDPDRALTEGALEWGRPDFEPIWARMAPPEHRISFPRATPGVFVVTARRGTECSARALVVCDLVTIVKRSAGGVLVYAARGKTGLPAAGVPVRLLAGGKSATARTDGSGVTRCDDPADGSGTLTALAGDVEHLAGPVTLPSLASDPDQGWGPIRVHLATDRPACFPGGRMHFCGVLRIGEGNRYRVVESGAALTAYDHLGRCFHREELSPTVSGRFWGSVPVPTSGTPGPVRLRIELDHGTHALSFPVAEPGDVQAQVRLSFLPDSPEIGEPVTLGVRATDRYGRLPGNAKVLYRVLGPAGDGERILTEGEGVLGAAGVLASVFTPTTPGVYRASAEVRDAGGTLGSDRGEVVVGGAEYSLLAQPDRLHCAPGETVKVGVTLTGPPGAPGGCEGRLHYADGEVAFEISPGETKEFPVEVAVPGKLGIVATVSPEPGVEARAECAIWVAGTAGMAPGVERIHVVPDRSEYAPGDRARFLILLPPDLPGATFLETLEGAKLGSHSVRRADQGVFRREVEIVEGLGEAGAYEVATVRNGRVARAGGSFAVRPGRDVLRVRVEAEPAHPAPGEVVRLRVLVEDSSGNPVAATASLSVFDAELEGLTVSPGPTLEQVFGADPRGNVVTASSRSGAAAGVQGREPGPEAAGPGPGHAVSESAGRSVLWDPGIAIGSDGASEAREIHLPARPARWRVVVGVVTPDSRVGTAELILAAEEPVTVDPHLPRTLVRGDIVQAPVTILSRLRSRIAGKLDFGAKGVRLVDEDLGSIDLDEESGEARVTVSLIADSLGDGSLLANFGADPRARAERATTVLPRGRGAAYFSAGVLSGRRTFVPVTLPETAVPEDAEVTIRLHLDASAAVADAVRHAPPDPSPGTLLKLALLGAKALGDPEPEDADRHGPLAVAAHLPRVECLQRADGGWGWLDDDPSSPLETSLVLQCLLQAKGSGAIPKEETVESARKYLRAFLSGDDGRSNPVAAALAVRILLFAGDPLHTSAEALLLPENLGKLPPAAAAHLILALLESDRRKDAVRVATRLDTTIHEGGGGEAWWGEEGAATLENDPVMTTSAVLLAHLALGSEASLEHARHAGRYLLDSRRGASFSSGRAAAAACEALLELSERALGPAPGKCAIRVRLGNAIVGGRRLSPARPEDRSATVIASRERLLAGRNRISIESTGETPVLFSVKATWATTEEHSADPGLGLSRTIRLRDGPPELSKVSAHPGDLLTVALRVESDKPRERLRLDCPFPAGTLPLRPGMSEALAPKLPPGTRMVRLPGRVRLLIPHLREGGTQIEFSLRVTHAGRFHTPPAVIVPIDFPTDEGASAEGPMLYVE